MARLGVSGLRRVLLGATLLRLFLVAAIPPGEAPDERAHAEFVRYLAEERRLPVQTERTGEGDRYEYYQPPLFYVLAAPLHGLAGGGDRALYAARVLNAVLSVLTVAAAARLARTWAPDRSSLPVGVAAFLAFHPSFAANGSTVNNDALLVLLSTLALERLGRAVRTPRLAPIDRLAATLLLALALLTKVSGAFLLPVVGLGLLVARRGLRGWAEAAGLVCGAALLASPWYLRNLFVYGGLLPHEIASVPWADRPPVLEAAAWEAGYAARTFWVAFGRHNEVDVYLLRPFLHALGALLLLLFARWAGREVRSPDPGARALAVASYTGVVLLLAFIASFGWRYAQAQGRFLFPVLAPLGAAVVSTLEEIARPERSRRIPALLACAFLALLGAEILGAFLPKYYPSVLPGSR